MYIRLQKIDKNNIGSRTSIKQGDPGKSGKSMPLFMLADSLKISDLGGENCYRQSYMFISSFSFFFCLPGLELD